MPNVALRPAIAEDAEAVFTWRNDEEVRALSRDSEPVEWDDHLSWFSNCLVGANSESVWIIEYENISIGSGRITKYEEDDRAEISIVLSEEYRGNGYGSEALKQLVHIVRGMGRLPVAWVRPSNARSLAAFKRAGFDFANQLLELHHNE